MRRPAKYPVHYGIAPVLRPFVPFQPLPLHRIGKHGIPLGYTRTGPFYFNPWELAAREIIGSPGLAVFGDLGVGKTTLAMTIGWWFGALRISPNDPESPFKNIWVDDSHAGEYAKLCAHFGGTPLRVADTKFNPLHKWMAADEQLVIVCQLLYMSDGFPVTPSERHILTSGIVKIIRSGQDASLHDLVRVINDSDTLDPAPIFEGSDVLIDVDRPSFQRDCRLMAMRLSNMLHGPLGKVFGFGTDPTLYAKFQDRIVNVDFEGASDDVKRVVQFMFWMMKKRNMFEVNIHDELHEVLRQVEFTRPLHDAVRFQRKSSKLTVLLTHRPQDYRNIPGEAGVLSWAVLKHTPMWFVGKLENEEDAVAVQEARGLSDKVTEWITKLAPHEYVAIIGNEIEPFRFKAFRPTAVRDMSFSNKQLQLRSGRAVR